MRNKRHKKGWPFDAKSVSQESKELTMLDITKPKFVEIDIRNDGKVVWINIDGICRLRACRIGKDRLVVNDRRKEET